ncbi:hypothetical protein TNCV_4855801 [Trichonephila clavipes]|nr:hypothetical protein TNCV_4855801 [Trichonephila clavipes]
MEEPCRKKKLVGQISPCGRPLSSVIRRNVVDPRPQYPSSHGCGLVDDPIVSRDRILLPMKKRITTVTPRWRFEETWSVSLECLKGPHVYAEMSGKQNSSRINPLCSFLEVVIPEAWVSVAIEIHENAETNMLKNSNYLPPRLVIKKLDICY